MRLCAVLASHNRRERTLAALAALMRQPLAEAALHVILVDDGSRDGTVDAVRAAWPSVQILCGDGRLYWCRAMHRAMAAAMASDPDHVLWLNDDTVLHADALPRLLACEQALRAVRREPVIVTGTTVDAMQQPIYGGRRLARRRRPLGWQLVEPTPEAQPVDVMDGNVVLLSRAVLAAVGNLEPRYEHAMGDYDYALRAERLGVSCWLAPGVHASGTLNARQGAAFDVSLPLARRWALLLAPKGLPWRSWLLFTRRHAGWWWPLYFLWPYCRVLLGRPPSESR